MTEPTDSPSLNRRAFAAQGLVAALAVSAVAAPGSAEAKDSDQAFIRPGDRVLFQGDSIADTERDRSAAKANDPAALGKGYAWLTAAQLLLDPPDRKLQIFNRGVSGDNVRNLADRWQKDCLELKPDVLSILVGINDSNQTVFKQYDGGAERYLREYRELLQQTLKALPHVRLIIGEPFLLLAGAVEESWFAICAEFRAAAKKLAEEFSARFVPYHHLFEAAQKIAPPQQWAADGVHPTPDGAALMARWWLEAAGSLSARPT